MKQLLQMMEQFLLGLQVTFSKFYTNFFIYTIEGVQMLQQEIKL